VTWRLGAALLTVALLAACGNPLPRKYEYEEETYLRLDGSATVYVNASVPALVALRGMDLPVDWKARLDRREVRALFDSPIAHVANVSASRRDYRRYVHLRIEVPDVRQLASAAPFAWSTYRFDQHDGLLEYRQVVGAAAGREVGDVGWTGSELVAFRLHLPSRVPFHNSPTKEVRRGNIIVWEQPLTDRRRGVPVDIQVQMERSSILATTLTLFGVMAVLVALTFAGFIWFVRSRKGGDA
jgi:hypothetical protein